MQRVRAGVVELVGSDVGADNAVGNDFTPPVEGSTRLREKRRKVDGGHWDIQHRR
jgi:hypothetical protein